MTYIENLKNNFCNNMIWFNKYSQFELNDITNNYINSLAYSQLNMIDLNNRISFLLSKEQKIPFNTSMLTSLCQHLLNNPQFIKKTLSKAFLYAKKDPELAKNKAAQYFCKSFFDSLKDNFLQNFLKKPPAEVIFESLYIINFSKHLENIINNFFSYLPSGNINIVLLDEIEFSFNFEDFFPLEYLILLSNQLTNFIHKNYDKEKSYKVIYNKGVFYLINGFKKENKRDVLLQLVNKTMQENNLNQKEFIDKMNWNYKSFSEFKNNSTKKIWSENNIEQKIKDILSTFDLNGGIENEF